MSFHSQHGEDRWCAENLLIPCRGHYVDIGAGAPISLSNTFWLQQLGWIGLLVEPDSRFHEALKQQRNAALLVCACGEACSERQFRITPQATHSGFLRATGELIPVVVRRLDEIVSSAGFPRVDFLSLDTEGTELEVWSTRGEYRPRIVIIEHDTQGIGNNRDAILLQLRDDDYDLRHTTACNFIFTDRRA